MDEVLFGDRVIALDKGSIYFDGKPDDFFKNENITSADLRIANEIINFRCVANKRTILSSERLVKDLIEIDQAIIGRIVEMAEEYLTEVRGSEKNYRLRNWLSKIG